MQAVVKSTDLEGYATAEARWARFGPYYAMFPIDFAFDVINRYSKKGDNIIDPFAGRCSAVYVGGVLGRRSVGIEINPVGWLYGAVKLNPADKKSVLRRLHEIDSKKNYYARAARRMPLFFKMCYCVDVLKFLLAARRHLNWRYSRVDATLMSIILVYLHGKIGEGLSNQMRMTKAMGPLYSINWWKKNHLTIPARIDPAELLRKKIEWRYGKGKPRVFDSNVILGDSTTKLNRVLKRAKQKQRKFSLLLTSPPYCDVTDYHADQWLRLWLLGGPEFPVATSARNKGRFINKEHYTDLLDQVFGKCAKLMKRKSVVYVRTDKRDFTFGATLEVLKKHFPHHKISIRDRPFQRRTQTDLHGNSSSEKGEIDIVLTRS
jgi:DNA modification methylase